MALTITLFAAIIICTLTIDKTLNRLIKQLKELGQPQASPPNVKIYLKPTDFVSFLNGKQVPVTLHPTNVYQTEIKVNTQAVKFSPGSNPNVIFAFYSEKN